MTSPVDPSALPRRERGLRSRAGNAMARTRGAVLDGASRAVEKHGARRATMSDIATLSGIAKGTLYNHFRTKEAVYAAAVEAGASALADECVAVARDDLAEALALAADRLASHPALRRIASDEPATHAALLAVGDSPAWTSARASVAAVLDAAHRDSGPPSVDVVLRWLVSFTGTSASGAEEQAAIVAAGLPVAHVAQVAHAVGAGPA
jgi:AcrR family transcriptional regulator